MIFKSQILLLIVFLVQTFNVIGNNSEIDSLIKRIEFTDDDISKCNLFNEIALKYLGTDPSEAIFYANKAFHLSFRINYDEGLASSYLIQGKANERLNKYEEALDYFLSSLVLQNQLNKENEIAEINFRLGRICKTIGNYEKALEYCLNSLRIRKKQEDFISVSNIYNTMGSIYKYLGDYDQALKYYLKCLDIQKKYSKEGVSAFIFNNIGVLYKYLNRYDEALRYYKKSLEIRRNNHDSAGIASSFNNIGANLLDQDKLDSAIYYLRKSKVLQEKHGNQKGLIHVYHNIGEYYYKSENYAEALYYTNKALSIAQQMKILQNKRALYGQLKDIYFAQRQFDKALDFQIRYTNISDSIYNVKKSMRIAQLEILYDNELKKVVQDLKDQRKMFVNYTIYGVLLFSFVILFFIYKNVRSKLKQNKLKKINWEMEKEKLNLKLETKNRELTRNIIHLTEKNELLHELKSTLQKLKSNMKDENKPLIQSVISDIKASNNNNIWEEFELRFTDTYKNFYNKLCADHNDLTQNERRLTAFLKLNMSTKEISMITRQSVHSIEVARTRLRKKLGLSNTDINLVSYLGKY